MNNIIVSLTIIFMEELMGRRKFTEKEKAHAKEKRKQKLKKRIENGLCRTCSKPTCKESKVFCEKHLINHRVHCQKAKVAGGQYSAVKSSAKSRGVLFELDRVEFEEWINNQPKECFYCGIQEMFLLENDDKKKKKLILDRKNNYIGYKIDNICLACFRCNNAKSYFFTCEEWAYISNHMIKPRLKEYHKTIFG